MGIEFVERFFKLTLDNVYRFCCSLLFVAAVYGCLHGIRPLRQLERLLDGLSIPAAWLTPVAAWMSARQDTVGWVAILVLMAGVALAASGGWRTRSGSSILLAVVSLMQTVQPRDLVEPGLAIGLLLVVAAVVCWKGASRGAQWVGSVGEGVKNVLAAVFFAAAHVLSPLGWLNSEEPWNQRGSRLQPLYIKQVKREASPGIEL